MALDEDDDSQLVELFARHGRAFYMANVVEDQLEAFGPRYVSRLNPPNCV
jgi:hypothetical protein